MAKLTLPLKREYFDAIKAGSKTEEYRLVTPYWTKWLYDVTALGRRVARAYSQIELTLGYPSAHDTSRRIVKPWRGFSRKTILHPHFGPSPVEVYAIDVSGCAALPQSSAPDRGEG